MLFVPPGGAPASATGLARLRAGPLVHFRARPAAQLRARARPRAARLANPSGARAASPGAPGSSSSPREAAVAFRAAEAEPDAAYVHIPFCRRRCFYCDFPIAVVGDGRGQRAQELRERYIDAVCSEIASTEAKAGAGRVPLQTVFFGGGTPSLLTEGELERILTALDGRFGVAAGAEVSVEMDPGTFDEGKLRAFLALGVSRVSLGIQSFHPALLQAAGRAHTAEEGWAALEALERVGPASFSLDLISGLPGQTAAAWRDSLRAAVACGAPHISTYDLTLEAGTAFARRHAAGRLQLPPEAAAADMYRETSGLLRAAGFEHYEISNYARPGFQCRHNRVYWENRPYWGFGMGAASYARGVRYTRPAAIREYLDWAARFAAAGGRLPPDAARLTAAERLTDAVMLSLRLSDGLSLEAVAAEFGAGAAGAVEGAAGRFVGRGWVEGAGGRLRLTDPEGFLFENVVLVALFRALDALEAPGPPHGPPPPA